MTEDEDDETQGSAIGETHILDNISVPRGSDNKPGADCGRKSPPWLPDTTIGGESSTWNKEVCYANQTKQECTANLRDDFAFITADMLHQEPVVSSLDSEPCRPPYCKFCPFRPVSAANGYPDTNLPVEGCNVKASPKSPSSPEPVTKMDIMSNEIRGIDRKSPSCDKTVEQNCSKLMERTNTPSASGTPPQQSPVIRLCRLKDSPVSPFYPRTFAHHDFTSQTPTALLTFALKHFILPQEVKLFNIGYFQKKLPLLFSCFIEFSGQGANGLVYSINDPETSHACNACSILTNNLKPLTVLIRNPRCLVYNEHEADITSQDAILTVVSADSGLVRLKPSCPATWEQWAQFPGNEDKGYCFIKRFTKSVKSDICQCLTCLHWPEEIAKEFRERKRESNWLDQNTLESITKSECRVVPFQQQDRPMHDIDWMLIFPEAECRLAELLTNEQRHCFCIFHIVMQHRLLTIPQTEESTTAISQLLINLDHVLFHACDTVQDHMWKMSPGFCFLSLVKILGEFLHNQHLPHYVVRNRNVFTKLSAKDFEILEVACQEILRSPLQLFQNLAKTHKFANAWVLKELLLCNRLIGGHSGNTNNRRVLLPLALRLSKEFMQRQCPEKAYECIEDIRNAVATSETDNNKPFTTDVNGFFAEIPNLEKDVGFLCQIAIYLKLSLSIDISQFLPDNFTNLQDAIGSSYELSEEIKDLPFPKFTDDKVSEKVVLLEGLVFQFTHYFQCSDVVVTLLKSTYGIAAYAIDNLNAKAILEDETRIDGHNGVFALNANNQTSFSCAVNSEADVLEESTEETRLLEIKTCGTTRCKGITADTTPSPTTDRTNRALEANTYKVVRLLRESQFRCLWNLFRCYEVYHCFETFETYLDDLERLCEQLGDPNLYKAFANLLRKLGYASRARQADEMAKIRENVAFGV